MEAREKTLTCQIFEARVLVGYVFTLFPWAKGGVQDSQKHRTLDPTSTYVTTRFLEN